MDRGARVVAVVASAWFALAISWGMFGRVAAGHDAVVAARAIAADNMLTWGILAPVREYTIARPQPSLYYAHHPFGSFWTITALCALLGRCSYVPRLAAVLTSAAAPPLLYGIGRSLWAPVPGALAALAYATLPMTLAFGNFPGFEVPVVTACLLATWGYLRFVRTRRRRWALVSLFGVLWAVNSDWEAHVFLAVVVAVLTALAFFSRRPAMDRIGIRQFAQWAALAALMAIATVLGYLAYFQSIDALGELFAQEVRRSRGNGTPLFEVLDQRRQWIDVTFTPLAVFVGKVALPVFVFRLLVLRRALEVFPLAMLAMAVVQYVKFKNGADVHIYWPYLFAPYYALSVAIVAESASALGRAAMSFFDERAAARAPIAAYAALGLVPLAILPDGLDALRYARMTGGRFNEKGHLALREEDKTQALEWMTRRFPGRTTVSLHQGMQPTWSQAWALHRPMETVNDVPSGRAGDEQQRLFAADLAFLGAGEQLRLAQSFPIVAVGHYVLADRNGGPGPAEGYVFDEREPKAWEWYLLSGIDPIRTIRRDPFYTWELREHYGQRPNDPPAEPPDRSEALRIAHNVAVAAGDRALAERYEEELLARTDRTVATMYDDGTELLGGVFATGAEPTLTLYFRAAGPSRSDFQFELVSRVEQRRALSLVPGDDKMKELGLPFTLPMRLWKRGFIYSDRNEIRHRPGRERFVGYFVAPGAEAPPRPRNGSATVTLLVVH